MKIDLTIFNEFQTVLIDSLPKFVGIFAFVVGSWLLLRILMFVLKRFLKFSKIDLLNKRLNAIDVFSSTGIHIDLAKIILLFLKWVLILALVILGADIFGLDKISEQTGKLVQFLPALFSAIAIFFVGIFLASNAKQTVKNILKSFDLGASNSISNVIFYVILIITLIIALNQLGIDTTIITDNISIFLGAALLSLSIALGLGSRDIVQRLLFGFYSRKNFNVGQKISIDGVKGTIVSIDNISLVLQTDNEKLVFPIKKIVNSVVEIID